MTVRQKITRVIILLLVIVTILRETGTIGLHYYHQNVNYRYSANSRSNSTEINKHPERSHSDQEQRISELPIIIMDGSDTLYRDTDAHDPLIVEITNLNYGFLWMPLYKSSDFSATASWDISDFTITSVGKKVKRTSVNATCTSDIHGNMTTYGFCSRYEAVQQIKKKIVKKLVQATRDDLWALEKKYR